MVSHITMSWVRFHCHMAALDDNSELLGSYVDQIVRYEYLMATIPEGET